MTKKYVAKYEHHGVALAEIEVEKETDKTITRTNKVVEIITGFYYLPERILKDNYSIFDTQEDALNWLISKAYNDIADLRLLIDRVQARIFSMSELKDKVK